MRIFFFTTIKAGCCCAERKELSLLLHVHVNKLKIKPQFYFEKLSIRGGVEMGGSGRGSIMPKLIAFSSSSRFEKSEV
jgi:hypothetical protein